VSSGALDRAALAIGARARCFSKDVKNDERA